MLTLGMDGKRPDCDDAGWESAPPPPKLYHFPAVVSDMVMQALRWRRRRRGRSIYTRRVGGVRGVWVDRNACGRR